MIDHHGPRWRVEVDRLRETVHAAFDHRGQLHLEHRAIASGWAVERRRSRKADDASTGGRIVAPTSGTIISVEVAVGDRVDARAVLVRMEAMKIESAISTPVAGTVTDLRVGVGDRVDPRAVLAVVDPASKATD